MTLKKTEASQNLLNVIELINCEPKISFSFKISAGWQADGKSKRYHLIDSLTPPSFIYLHHRLNAC